MPTPPCLHLRLARGLAVASALVLTVGQAGAARAHGARLPFAAWGGFAPAVVRRQREIARAAAQCAADARAARRGCRDAVQAGGSCDESATAAAIANIRRAAFDRFDAACSERQAIDPQFLGSFDLQADLITFCRAWETAADSAAYGPLAIPAPTATERQCLDRLASLPLPSPDRTELIDIAAHRMAASQSAVAERLTARCGAGAFTALYGRSPETWVDALSQRADCLGGSIYIQNLVLCPAGVCGNGIVEPGEDCDDGNRNDGDACPAGCLR